jgi:hypothetical protein
MKVNYVQESRKFDHPLESMIHSQIVGVANPLCILLRLILVHVASVISSKKSVWLARKAQNGNSLVTKFVINFVTANAGVNEMFCRECS